MTGIAGVVRIADGGPLDEKIVEPLIAMVRTRSRGAPQVFRTERVMLASCARPSAADSECGTIIAGDLRLDNNDELVEALGLAPGLHTDESVVLAAYGKWGADCCERLRGDFAFALWDPSKQVLLCARDHFGVRPLFYRIAPGAIFFATDEKALGAKPYGEHTERYLSAFLAGIYEPDEELAHPGIFRLLPGHRLEWRDGTLNVSRYWVLSAHQAQDGDPEEIFRSLFLDSIQARSKGAGRLATMLSGGLDSSSITASVVYLRKGTDAPPVGTYSLVYEQRKELDERPFIESVVRLGSLQPTYLPADGYRPFSGLAEVINVMSGLYFAPGLLQAQRLYHAAAADGCDVILDGHGGDEVVWKGATRVAELAVEGQWITMARLMLGSPELFGTERGRLFFRLLRNHAPRRSVGRLMGRVGDRIGRTLAKRRRSQAELWPACVNESFAKRVDLKARLQAAAGLDPLRVTDDRAFHQQALASSMIGRTFEVLDKASAAAGIEARYPFFDLRLVEFCLGLPAHEKLRFGEPRSIIRRALKGILPEDVRRRRSKANFIGELAAGMAQDHQVLDDLLAKPGALEDYANMRAVREMICSFRQRPTAMRGTDVMFIWRLVCFHLWLNRAAS